MTTIQQPNPCVKVVNYYKKKQNEETVTSYKIILMADTSRECLLCKIKEYMFNLCYVCGCIKLKLVYGIPD